MSQAYGSLYRATIVLALGSVAAASAQECPLNQKQTFRHDEIGTIQILQDVASNAIAFASQMHVNTDGAPDSYHPDDIGITHICNGVSVGPRCSWERACLPAFRQARTESFCGPTKVCFFAMATREDEIGGRDVIYVMFPDSAARGEPIDLAVIERNARPLFDRFGGIQRLQACESSIVGK